MTMPGVVRRIRHKILLRLLAFLASCPITLAAVPSEDAVYVYDLFKGNPSCAQLTRRLKAASLRPTVILSIEQGGEFVLDRPNGADQVSCALRYLRASSRKARFLFLQDAGFLEKQEEAARRAALVAEFVATHRNLVAGVHVDVEPHTMEECACGGVDAHRRLLGSLHAMLRRVRGSLADLPLAVIAPWWLPAAAGVPEATLDSLLGSADEICLMVYGDAGGPLVGGTAERVLSRLSAPGPFSRGRVYVAVASYEAASRRDLDAEIAGIRSALRRQPAFAGTVVFHATAPFNAPLLSTISGRVTGPNRQGLPGVELTAGGVAGRSNSCGQFYLRGSFGKRVEINFNKPPFRTRTVTINAPPPGGIQELGDVVLEPENQQ